MRGDERLRLNTWAVDNSRTMNANTPTRASAAHQRGFTLIELMIAVVIVAILAAVALPSFLDSVRKGRRADAFAAITRIQQAQEQWRGSHAAYTDTLANTAVAPALANGLGVGAESSSGYYAMRVDLTATGYDAVATAVAGKSQAEDGTCKVLGIRLAGNNLEYGSGATAPIVWWTAANPDPARCWAR